MPGPVEERIPKIIKITQRKKPIARDNMLAPMFSNWPLKEVAAAKRRKTNKYKYPNKICDDLVLSTHRTNPHPHFFAVTSRVGLDYVSVSNLSSLSLSSNRRYAHRTLPQLLVWAEILSKLRSSEILDRATPKIAGVERRRRSDAKSSYEYRQ